MTREDIEYIIKWFSHIEQLATDGKTANGFQMPTDKLLATIKVVAKDSREYVEKFCNESIPNDLGAAAKEYEHNRVYEKELEKYGFYLDSLEEGEEPKMKEPSKETKFLLNADIIDAFIAGAKWQKEQDLAEMAQSKSPLSVAYANRCFENGKQAMKEQMLKDAVEGEVCGRVHDHINVRFADGICKFLEPKNISHIPADVSKYKVGDKVKIIIVKED